MHKRLMVALIVLVLGTSLALGSGYSIYEQGAKAMAMSGAFTAQANDVTAIFYNPAGLTQLKGFNLSVGTTLIFPKSAFTGPTDIDPNLYNELEDQTFFPSTFYASYQVNDQLALGLGFFTPFGLGTNWGNNWVGKHLATESDLKTFFLNPTVAYEVTPGLSIGVGLEYVIAEITLNRAAYFTPRDLWGKVELGGDDTAIGWNAGLRFQATDQLALGVSYRSEVALELDGTATFDFPSVNPVVNAEVAALFPESKGIAPLTLPSFLAVGVSFQPTDELTFEVDWLQIGWSAYDKLSVDFKNETAAVTDTDSPKNWEDSYSIRFGVQYQLNDDLAIRGGVMRDNDPAPDETLDPILPGADRTLFSLGLGYTMDNLQIDGGYMLLLQDDREISTSEIDWNGKYESIATLFAISFGYSF